MTDQAKRLTLISFAAALVAACSKRTAPDFTEQEQREWAFAQQKRFDALATHYAPNKVWAAEYMTVARLVWSYGHQGQGYPVTLPWPKRSTKRVPPLVTSRWGSMVNSVGYWRHNGKHSGIDIVAPYGEPVYSTMEGRVTHRTFSDSLGGYIRVKRHDVVTEYLHMSRIKVDKGQYVHRGQMIGTVGDLGSLSGKINHLHLTYRVGGETKDPEPEITRNNLAYPIRW